MFGRLNAVRVLLCSGLVGAVGVVLFVLGLAVIGGIWTSFVSARLRFAFGLLTVVSLACVGTVLGGHGI